MDIYNINTSFELLSKFINSISMEISNLEERCSMLPAGILTILNNGKYTQWHVTTSNPDMIAYVEKMGWNIINDLRNSGSKKIVAYIPKSEAELARNLLHRELLEKELAVLNKIRKMSELCFGENGMSLREMSLVGSESKRLMILDEYRELMIKYDTWMSMPYIHNEAPFKFRYTTKKGFDVRSKSELIIANLLIDYKIPFLYEPYMMANGNQHFPDFVIIHPHTRKVYIWEHNGMLDDSNYIYKAQKRYGDYSREGFLLDDDLIFTNETSDRPLRFEIVEENIMRIMSDTGTRRNTKWDFDKWNEMIHN